MRQKMLFLGSGILLGSLLTLFFLQYFPHPLQRQAGEAKVAASEGVPGVAATSLAARDAEGEKAVYPEEAKTLPAGREEPLASVTGDHPPTLSTGVEAKGQPECLPTGGQALSLLARAVDMGVTALSEQSPQASPETPVEAGSASTRQAYLQPPLALDMNALPFSSKPSRFSLHKIGPGNGPTLLVVGGIQGHEPGGFSAASLLATHYKITSGAVWVVPDLNFASILDRGRGLFGDMNRKFATLPTTDPEYDLVCRIKDILLDKRVDVVLNLHDGSGFYRPTWEDAKNNPKRWGQSVIIDQKEVNAPRFSQLEAMALRAGSDVNEVLVSPEHRYHIHNTNTSQGDKEMEKSLSYFVVRNGKAAFGIEASKEFTTEYRSYYHIQVIESFMRQMGITFERTFPLKPENVLVALNSNLKLSMFEGRIVLPLDNVRPHLGRIPFKKNCDPSAKASRPLLAVVKDKESWRVAYGNRTLTRMQADVMPFDDSLGSFSMTVDGTHRVVGVGEVVQVKKSFEVEHIDGYRVNAIGAKKERNGTEAGVLLVQDDFMPRFSVDKAGTIFRVEIYKGNAFAGMIMVDFGNGFAHGSEPLTAVKGAETDMGY